MRIGRKMIHLESVDSTNNYVANMIKDAVLASGTVIMADDQFEGKGQRGAEWLSSAGMNLTLSIYLNDVNLSVDRQFKITQIISVGIQNFLNKCGIVSTIKWPNDSYVNDSKIAGMLIENRISAGKIDSTIIGIGLNVNQLKFGTLNATSMSIESGKTYLLSDLYFSFIHTIDETWNALIDDESSLNRAYLNGLYRRGELHKYSDASGLFEGEIIGVTPIGKLKIRRDNSILDYSLKEVKFL
ncbi:MAG: BirA family biotin operon repressor/biotin-[acetyl-CoA-carboxylase] ligase [Flavobacteriaceae bacterium]|jgi:BirA family biotin operon repressor/biotin-[acetyl-CoA-carboxylase] ligase